MVGAAADDHAGRVLRNLTDHIRLCQIKLVGQAHAVQPDRAEHGQRVQEAVCRPFIQLFKQLFIKAGLFGRPRDQLAVIKGNAKAEREFLADFTAACAVFTADGDD